MQITKSWRPILKYLIIFTIIINAIGLYFPILRNDDPVLYANIAKNILLSNDWINLTYLGNDWLDKPHVPFWITALSFKIFGINSFAYILPGFLFHILGGYYTYCLACRLYNVDIGLLAALFYFSALHLLLSSIDVRAEAYLLGMIMPACYYWYLYSTRSCALISDVAFNISRNTSSRFKFIKDLKLLFLGSFFTALALMTKGVFVIIPIFSGVFALCFIHSPQVLDLAKYARCVIKIFGIGLFIILLIAPEVIALYLQFDSHPEKLVFSTTHVSGIRWFLWDSQFGRFFNQGPIVRNGSSGIAHYFYFIHTFLWSFLPWSIFFVIALCSMFKSLKHNHKLTLAQYYLLWSFCPQFIVFSLTSFQLDYYTNILIPFAAIICANWVYHKVLSHSFFIKIIIYLTIFIDAIFLLAITIHGVVYAKYDTGYQIAQYLNQQVPRIPVVDYKVDSLTLKFYLYDSESIYNKNVNGGLISNVFYERLYSTQDMLDFLKKFQYHLPEFYVIVPQAEISNIMSTLLQNKYYVKNPKIVYGATIDKVIPNIIRGTNPKSWLIAYGILYVVKIFPS